MSRSKTAGMFGSSIPKIPVERMGRWLTSAAADARLLPARVGGVLLATASGVTAVLRRTKPLHSIGGVTHATWQVTQPAGLDVPLLDSPLQRVMVRLSRAASLTRVGWDVMGLAVRAPHGAVDGHDADLLFATTGTGPWTRFLVVPRPAWGVGDYTTLFPLTWRGGTVVLRLHARAVTDYDVLISTRGDDRPSPGTWRTIGRLVLDSVPITDEPLRFRPVASPPAGLAAPPWVRALRQPAYLAARRIAHP